MSRHNAPEWNPRKPMMPVDEDGNWLSYPYVGHARWEEVPRPFYAEFRIDGMRTGRSSKVVILKDIKGGFSAPMFVVDLVKGIQNGDFTVEQRADGGRIIGWWTGSKRGANYGIKAIRTEVNIG